MSGQSQIDAALVRMETVFADMAKTVDAEDLDQRRRLIALRRALSTCFFELNRAVDDALSAGEVDADHVSDYRRRFSAFRRAVSLHQTEWPTILISDNMAAYVAASQVLRGKRDAFVAWIRLQFLPRIAAR